MAVIRDVVGKVVPTGARVLVISKGDPDMLDIKGRRAEHFPQNPDGSYIGYHPADSAEVITHLKCLQVRADEYVVIPSTRLIGGSNITSVSGSTSQRSARKYFGTTIVA